MKRLLVPICLAFPGVSFAQCIPSGVTDQYTYFVAVDSVDKVTRETGLSSFTVVRSRNGAADATYTTPTVSEIDGSTMPGVYALLLDEDMTIGTGNDVELIALHITASGMEPVTKEICIARSKITEGETLTVSGGVASGNMVQISGDAGAADALELAFDGEAGAVPMFGIARKGTAQSATSSTLVMDSGAPFGDDTLIGATVVACGSTQGYCQSRIVIDNTGSSDTLTVEDWEVTPSGDITFYLFLTAASSGGGDGEIDLEELAEAMWTYGSRELTALDEDNTAIDLNSTAVGSVAGNVGGTVNGLTAEGIADEVETRFPANFADLAIAATTGRVDVGLIEGSDATDQIRDAVVDDATRLDGSAVNAAATRVATGVPNAAPGGTGGLPTVDSENRVAGIQGTINTLDGLDTAQDAQHAATKGVADALKLYIDSLADGSGSLLGCTFTINASPSEGEFYVNVASCTAPE